MSALDFRAMLQQERKKAKMRQKSLEAPLTPLSISSSARTRTTQSKKSSKVDDDVLVRTFTQRLRAVSIPRHSGKAGNILSPGWEDLPDGLRLQNDFFDQSTACEIRRLLWDCVIGFYRNGGYLKDYFLAFSDLDDSEKEGPEYELQKHRTIPFTELNNSRRLVLQVDLSSEDSSIGDSSKNLNSKYLNLLKKEFLIPLAKSCSTEELQYNHVLLNIYPPPPHSLGIMAHTDGPTYESKTTTITLDDNDETGVMEFWRRKSTAEIGQNKPDADLILRLRLPDNSALSFEGAWYEEMLHAIPSSADCLVIDRGSLHYWETEARSDLGNKNDDNYEEEDTCHKKSSRRMGRISLTFRKKKI